MSDRGIERNEARAAWEARRELGPDYDHAMAEAFADRVEQAVEARVQERLQRGNAATLTSAGAQVRQFVLGVGSLVAGIPITIVPMVAVEGGSGLPAVIVAWLGIAGVNAAHAASVNGPHRP